MPAEVFPFIDEALIDLGVRKCAVISKSLSIRKQAAIAQSLREKQRKARAEDEEVMAKNEEFEEDDVSFIDPTCISLPWIVEILLSTLSESSNATLQAASDNWKPPSSISYNGTGSASKRKDKSRDPRLAEMQSQQNSMQMDSLTSNSTSQDFPNENVMDSVDAQETLKNTNFFVSFLQDFFLKSKLPQYLKLKSYWTNILTRLVNFLATSIAGIKEAFLKFVFENF